MDKSIQDKKQSAEALHVRLPGFISDEEIGLGDAITRITSKFGIRPCNACQQRASTFNSWVVFSRNRQ